MTLAKRYSTIFMLWMAASAVRGNWPLGLSPSQAAENKKAQPVPGGKPASTGNAKMPNPNAVTKTAAVGVSEQAKKQAKRHLDRAMTLFHSNQINASYLETKQSLQFDPNNADACLYLAFNLLRMERIEESLSSFDRYFALVKTPAESAYLGRANCYCSLGKVREALPDLDHAVTMTPKDSYPLNQRAQAYSELGQLDKAIADSKKMVSLDPNAGNLALQAKLYMRAGKYAEALDGWNKVIALVPDMAISYTQRANVYDKLGQHALAAKDRKKASELVDY